MTDEYPTVKAAAVQAAPVFLDRERTLEKACDLIAEAGAAGAEMTVFPEGFVPGHPLWYHYHPATGTVSKRLATLLFKNAVEVPGPATRRLAEAAAQANTYVTMGVCEKVPNTTGTMYNTQLFFSPEGDLIGKHQKLKPTVGERLVHADGNGDTLGTIPTEYGPTSGLICGENSNPLAIFALAAEHTRIHSMSWPPSFSNEGAMPEKVLTFSRAFAQMSKAFVVSACGVLDERMIEMMELTEEEAADAMSPDQSGGSVIVGPDLEVVAGPLENEEAILYGELDLELGVARKLTHDFAGHYNRPDVFQLRVNRTPSNIFTDSPPSSDAAFEPVLEEDHAPRNGVDEDAVVESGRNASVYEPPTENP